VSVASRARRRVRRLAHGQGLTVSGYGYVKAGGPRSLAERTSGSLNKQATREIATAYKPALASVDRRKAQINAIDAKRAADEGAFQSWLTTQQATLRSEAAGRDAQLRTALATHKAELQTALTAATSGTPGAGGIAPTQPNALEAATAASIQGRQAESQLGVERQMHLTGQLQTANQGNELSLFGNLQAQRQAETYQQLADAADGEDKIRLQQAADLAKRLADLTTNEQTKAQVRIASQQFAVKEANDAADAAASRATTRAGQAVTKHGQELSHADRVAARKQQAQQHADDFEAKHGIPFATYQGWSASHKRRFLADEKAKDKAAGGRGADETNRIRKARTQLSQGVGAIINGVPGKDKDGNPIIVRAPANNPSQWLQQHGYPKEVADAAAFIALQRKGFKGKMPRRIKDALYKLTGIRGL
jgi:hypothetical protein